MAEWFWWTRWILAAGLLALGARPAERAVAGRAVLQTLYIPRVESNLPAAVGDPLVCEVKNIAWSDPGRLLRGGRPDEAELACLAAEGVDVLVDQRLPSEDSLNEAAVAAELGMTYINLGIADDTAPSPETLRAWIDTVEGHLAAGRIVLVHDAAGRGRMGFWDAVYAARHGLLGAADAIEARYLGKALPFTGASIQCGDGGNGQVQALADVAAALDGAPYYPEEDEYGTEWEDCPRPDYMLGWDYAAVLGP